MKTSTKIFIAKFISNFIRFLIKSFGKNIKKIVTKRNQIFFSLDLTEGIDFAIFLNLYEKKVLNFYSKIVKPNFTIIDIGSNIGFHTLNFAKLCSKGKVYSIEPTFFAFSKLKHNISLNTDLKKIIIFEQIFFSRLRINKKKEKVYASWPLIKTKKKTHPVLMGQEKGISNAKVECLDKYILRKKINNVDMIKIDVDGNEYDVLKSGTKTIINFKPIIMIEFCPYLHKDKDLDYLLKFFNKLNYKFINSSNSQVLELKCIEDLKQNIGYGSSENFFLISE